MNVRMPILQVNYILNIMWQKLASLSPVFFIHSKAAFPQL